jgi:hypothetical protein
MKAYCWLLLGLLLLLGSVVHAEGECPPGMFPTNPPGAQGPVGCAPIPGYDQQQQPTRQQTAPPPRWASGWMAIATDSMKGSLGSATDLPSRDEAERAALADCQAKGGSQCKLQVSYGNGCAAMVAGNKEFNVNGAATLDEAVRIGMKMCAKAGDSNCHVYYSACSLPIRIQ